MGRARDFIVFIEANRMALEVVRTDIKLNVYRFSLF
jgi:hypothetical protein